MEVFVQPAELLQNNQNPELNEWWQLIAWNASKKIFEDNNKISIPEVIPILPMHNVLVFPKTMIPLEISGSASQLIDEAMMKEIAELHAAGASGASVYCGWDASAGSGVIDASITTLMASQAAGMWNADARAADRTIVPVGDWDVTVELQAHGELINSDFPVH